MRIGVLKEIKDNEYRVALTPQGASKLVGEGAEVLVEKDAGLGSGFEDEEYAEAGAQISTVKEILDKCELILKIKEPVKQELNYFNKKHTVFTYFHFASGKELTEAMMKSGANCIAYETVSSETVKTPLLAPMSEVAGRMAPHIGAYYLAKPNGGRGMLMQGISTVKPGKVVILGGGNAGGNAAEVAIGMGANVTIVDLKERMDYLKKKFPKATIVENNASNIEKEVVEADLLISSIYVVGERAKKIVSKELVSKMKKGSVIVDISIDQGGGIETSRPTTHSNPVFTEEGVVHYCVANMPGAFPRTSTLGITNATLPYILKMHKNGIVLALKEDKGLKEGVNVWQGKLISEAVAKAHGMKSSKLEI